MSELRAQIVAEIMKLVRQPMVPMDHKPTIDELEAMLNSETVEPIRINPDGSVSVQPPPATVGDIADAVLRIIEPAPACDPEADTGCADDQLLGTAEQWREGLGTLPSDPEADRARVLRSRADYWRTWDAAEPEHDAQVDIDWFLALPAEDRAALSRLLSQERG